MLRSLYPLTALCLACAGLVLASVACHPGPPQPPGPPGGGTISEKLGEGTCREVPAYATPLIMDWRSDQRAELETAMVDGVVVVKYDCNTIEIVRGCRAEGAYGFMGVQRKEDSLQLADADEIRANLPTFGAKLSAELVRGSALDLAYVTVGKKRTLLDSLERSQLPEACGAATHFVRGAYVGAFAVRDGKAGTISAAAEIFGYGASGKSQQSTLRNMRDGEPKACTSPVTGQAEPPTDCGSLLRLELVQIGADAKAGDLEVSACPQGMVLVADKCTEGSGAGAFLCNPTNPKECEAQCEKGSAASCAYYGYSVHYALRGVTKDLDKARELYERSCSKGIQFGCAGLGIMYEHGVGGLPRDGAKANSLARKACDAGVPRGCNNLGVSYEKGRGVAMDQARATELYRRACAGGLPYACVNLGISYEAGRGVPQDMSRARELYEQSCEADDGESCLQLGTLYQAGREVPQDHARAAALYRKACEGARSSRGNEGCRQLGWAYVLGRGLAKDVATGIRTMRTACDDGHGASCIDLSMFYFGGEHVEKNELTGNSVLESACGKGVGDGCSDLGYSYEKGRGVAVNFGRSQEYYAKACELESGRGCHNLAVTARGVPAAQVEKLLEKSCSLGYPKGCYEYGLRLSWRGDQTATQDVMLGACAGRSPDACVWLATRHSQVDRRPTFAETACELARGDGCFLAGQAHELGRGVQKSHLKAADFYDRACKAKHGPGCTALAALYESSPDLPRDSARATALRKQRCLDEAPRIAFWNCKPEWVQEICAEPETCAQYAYKLAKGSHGQPADPKLAASLWKRGCEGKHYNSCWGLAEAYEFGWGVGKSRASSRKYFKQACEYGADPVKCKAKLEQK